MSKDDVAVFEELVRWVARTAAGPLGSLFETGRPVVVARAPGRLDVMGGFGDYSGSLVLQLPIAEATLVAAQLVEGGGVDVVSLPVGPVPRPAAASEWTVQARRWSVSAEQWRRLLDGSLEEANRFFQAVPESRWAAYPVGTVLAFAKQRGFPSGLGLRLLIHSAVPEGKGVSSSAALEVATLQAVTHWLGQPLDGTELARLCQQAENVVVGAPCGIMDQMTAALGRANQLLALLCQPALVEGFVPVPGLVRFWGVDSGLRHAVSGSDYTSVRTGTFMGYRILAELAGLRVAPLEEGRVRIDDPRWKGFLANVTPEEFEREFAQALPERMSGQEFLERYGGTPDVVTRVDPDRVYPVRHPTAHPVYEHARVRRFAELLQQEPTEDRLVEMGRLMYASHASYTACGLGSDGTDRLVELVRQRGPQAGLFGAKITGGGSGGAVAVLGWAEAEPEVLRLAEQYRSETGRETYVFAGSSDGACRFGVRTLSLG